MLKWLRISSEIYPRLKILRCALSAGCGLAMVIAIPFASAQIMPTPPRRSGKITAAAVTHPELPPVTAPPAAQALTRADVPPSAPQVSWDGSQLTIITNYSTLSEILAAVRARTGAEIDIPESAARQRMAAKLGPGPVRDVLSSLLSWTDFNYVIQASDKDPDSIQSIQLIPRPKDAIELAATRPGRGEYRQDSEANPNLAEAQDPQESQVSTQSAAVELPPSGEPTAPLVPPPPGADSSSTISDLQPSIANSQTAAAITESTPGANQTKVLPQMIEQLQSMYQQRLQLQENQKPRTDQAP